MIGNNMTEPTITKTRIGIPVFSISLYTQAEYLKHGRLLHQNFKKVSHHKFSIYLSYNYHKQVF
jgi:hypothetical protein